MMWDRVAERVRTTGIRLPAEAILEGRDADRRAGGLTCSFLLPD